MELEIQGWEEKPVVNGQHCPPGPTSQQTTHQPSHYQGQFCCAVQARCWRAAAGEEQGWLSSTHDSMGAHDPLGSFPDGWGQL